MIPKTKRAMALCMALLACNLLFIWGNSLMPASVSGAFSQWLRDLLGEASGGGAGQSDGLLRKIAHFAEFASLGMLLSWLFAMLKERKNCGAACGSLRMYGGLRR